MLEKYSDRKNTAGLKRIDISDNSNVPLKILINEGKHFVRILFN